jgi:hypothetical protein
MRFHHIACVIAALCILALPGPAFPQAPQNCGPDCAQRMTDFANQLAKDNQALANRMSLLERELSAAQEAIKRLGERRIILRDTGKDKDFARGSFWTATNPTHVNYTCPDKNVLVGLEFEMWSDGAGRHPSNIKFICRELTQ